MAEISRKTLRFYLDNPTHKKAWDYLQNLDKERFKSCNDVVAIAVADYFENREREERLISRIAERIMGASPHFPAVQSPTQTESVAESADEINEDYIDFGFVGG